MHALDERCPHVMRFAGLHDFLHLGAQKWPQMVFVISAVLAGVLSL